jgi:hypothetical protein
MIRPDERPHPAPPRLEAVAAGDEPGPIAAHLEACEACAAYVAQLKGEAEAFLAQANPTAFAEAIRVREAASRPKRRAAVVWVVGPMVAAAAAILLWLRASPEGVGAHEGTGVTTAPSSAPSAAPTDEVARFKGGLAVAAIRERGDRQERLTGPFEVQAFDRIRIEIAVDHEEPVTAGLLASDGTWTILEAPVTLSAGTHYSDLAARFDATPTDALLLVGSPVDVERARRTRRFEDVVAWRVTTAPAEDPKK